MATGPEMLLNSLIKLFKLEPYIETLRRQIITAAEEGWVDKVKEGVEQIGTFDKRLSEVNERLERIERLGIGGAERIEGTISVPNTAAVEPGASSRTGERGSHNGNGNSVVQSQIGDVT